MMKNSSILHIVAVVFTFLTITSCIRDEFKFGDVQVDEEWKMKIASPLFSADLEFKDLIHDWDTVVFQGNEQTSNLEFSSDSVLKIPSRIIFEPATIIDSLFFLINGNYDLASVELKYVFNNGCPFPLNFQMCFFEHENSSNKGPAVLPEPFLPAMQVGNTFEPVTTIQKVVLNEQQLQSFKTADRMEIATWFEWSDLVNSTDTFSAKYPLNISIILIGEVIGKVKNE